MTYEKEDENEGVKLYEYWQDLIKIYEGKEVVCTITRQLNSIITDMVHKDKVYTVDKVEMYLGTTPCFKLKETGTRLWHPDSFKLK